MGLVLALLTLATVIGVGWVIARHLARQSNRVRRYAGYASFAVLPFIGIWLYVAVATEPVGPTLTAQQRQYNVAMASVIMSMIFALPWLVALMLGWRSGRNLRSASEELARLAEPTPEQPAYRTDNPRLSLAQLEERMNGLAMRGGVAASELPHGHYPPEGTGWYIRPDKFEYIYGLLRDGETVQEDYFSTAEELFARVFGDVADRRWPNDPVAKAAFLGSLGLNGGAAG